jgi:hypothetical protein
LNEKSKLFNVREVADAKVLAKIATSKFRCPVDHPAKTSSIEPPNSDERKTSQLKRLAVVLENNPFIPFQWPSIASIPSGATE